MKAVIRTEYGSPDVIEVVERDIPEPGPREVRVRVEAAGVDIGVWHLLTGLPTMVRLAVGLPRPRQAGLGAELAGVVDAVGSRVTRFRPGDAVFGVGTGTFAEYAVAQEKHLVARPGGVSPQHAASSAVSGVSALQALRAAGVTAGSRVLILGASGGVGSFAVQIAKASGAHVTGVASAAKLDMVRKLGTDAVVDYSRTDPTDGTHDYDVILEMGGRRRLPVLRRALTARGRVIVVGGEGGGRVTGGFLGNLTLGARTAFRAQKAVGLVSSTTTADLAGMGELLASGDVVPAIDEVLPLDAASDALWRIERHEVRGKLVVDPAL
jgi:NADPH:quinone reductase-like Zn-dependent oxidoreductase